MRATAPLPAPGEGGFETPAAPVPSGAEPVAPRPRRYLVFLVLMLSTAAFFDYYSTTLRFHLTTYVRQDFGLEFSSIVGMFRWVFLGSCLAFVPRLMADWVGRKWMLVATLALLCVLQFAVGYARDPTEYILLLAMLAIVYKSDIWLLVMAEEAPPRHRATLTAFAVGAGLMGSFVAGVMIRNMGDALGAWRAVARMPIWGVLACIPLVLFMRETRHFQDQRRGSGRLPVWKLAAAPLAKDLRRRLIVICLLNAVFVGGFFCAFVVVGVEFLRVDNGFDPRLVGLAVQLEVLASAAGAVACGWLADGFGRHRAFYGFGVLYVLSLLALSLAPRITSIVMAAYACQSLAQTAMNTLLRITGTEIFPSDRRATGLAWAELSLTLAAAGTVMLLGLITASATLYGVEVNLSRVIVGIAALTVLALPLFALLPETRGVRLEEV